MTPPATPATAPTKPEAPADGAAPSPAAPPAPANDGQPAEGAAAGSEAVDGKDGQPADGGAAEGKDAKGAKPAEGVDAKADSKDAKKPKRPPPPRAVPDYDGRGEPPTTAGDVLRGVGRVLLFPVRVVVDYGVRWPLGYLVRKVEHSRAFLSAIRYVFLQPAAPTMSIFPIAFYDFGFQSSIGVRMLWTNGFLFPGSRVSIKLGTGGRDWWRGDLSATVAAPYGLRWGVDIGLRHRPDQQFFGLGPRAPQEALARYAHTRAGISVSAGWPALQVWAGSVTSGSTESHYDGDPSIEDQVAAGRIEEAPPGYGQLLVTSRAGLRFALDSRWRERDAGLIPPSGVRLDAVIERVHESELGSWWHSDVTIGAALILDRIAEHKLDVRARVELIEPDDDAIVPFLELATVGGSRDLRGFASGRGRDKSAATFTLDYQWPLAAWLDATLYLAAGNVFGEGLSGFAAGNLRGTLGFGLGIAGIDKDRQIELWTAVGTEPFDEGLEAAGFRLVLGYSHDY